MAKGVGELYACVAATASYYPHSIARLTGRRVRLLEASDPTERRTEEGVVCRQQHLRAREQLRCSQADQTLPRLFSNDRSKGEEKGTDPNGSPANNMTTVITGLWVRPRSTHPVSFPTTT